MYTNSFKLSKKYPRHIDKFIYVIKNIPDTFKKFI